MVLSVRTYFTRSKIKKDAKQNLKEVLYVLLFYPVALVLLVLLGGVSLWN